MQLVLSLFPGIDLLGRAFEDEGFFVTRGPDLIFGGDIRRFFPPQGIFHGVIGGSPCQEFSSLLRTEPTGYGVEMVMEFIRCVQLASPDWFLLENVPRVPSIEVPGYVIQRFNLAASECGSTQRRLRAYQFGSRNGWPLVIRRASFDGPLSPAALATEGNKKHRRTWPEFCQLQGLPADYDLPSMKKGEKYRAVGNGVPIPMGRTIARAILARTETRSVRLCLCDCGREVTGNQVMATAACRKRMERRRRDCDRPGVSVPGPGTAMATLSR